MEGKWEKFESTGTIFDYLDFVACTKEKDETYEKEGECSEHHIHDNRDHITSNGYWGI